MNTDIFQYDPDKSGGTEYMAREWHARLEPDLPKFAAHQCYVIPGRVPTMAEVHDGTPIIVWIHNPLYQLPPHVSDMFADPAFLANLRFLVVVSEWHRTVMIETTDVDPEKIVVIPDAINPIPHDLDRFTNVETVRIIHASHPDRAMEVLIPAVHMIADDVPFELEVFNEFFPDTAGVYGTDIEPVVLDPRITYYGKTPRATVMKHMASAHIHAYPAFTFEETCCLSQVEALATGCLTVVSDRGALPETSRGNGMIVPFTGNRDKDIEVFAKRLAAAISVVHTGMWHPTNQADDTMGYYSWDQAGERWSALHDRL